LGTKQGLALDRSLLGFERTNELLKLYIIGWLDHAKQLAAHGIIHPAPCMHAGTHTIAISNKQHHFHFDESISIIIYMARTWSSWRSIKECFFFFKKKEKTSLHFIISRENHLHHETRTRSLF